MEAHAGLPQQLVGEPTWPSAQAGPHVFLLDASSTLERKLLEAWIERHRPASAGPAEVSAVRIPSSRRPRFRRRVDRRLEALIREGDPLLIPLRVVWLPPERDGRRVVGWRDIFVFGDPRDPDPLRQHAIIRTFPDRVRIVAGEPARAVELEQRWASPSGRGRNDGTSLADFVALQAWLALERAERELRGSRYKVPKFLREDLFESRHFTQGIARLARESGQSFEAMSKRTYRYLKEIAATHSPYVIDLVAGGIGWLIGKAYSGLHYDQARLAELYAIGQRHPLVFLPSHKSNFDHLVLQYVLYENQFPPNHTAGGINMNFFPVGPLVRRTGVFFIRREFKENAPYKFVLRQYVDYLLEKRFPLEWYLEGGRSRSGKLRAPRLGMLAYVVASYRGGSTDDVVVIPVSIAYDQIQDVGAYAAEQRGGKKEKESFGWFINTLRSLRVRYGAIHIRFGRPISLRERLGPPAVIDPEAPEYRLEVPKLAFEVSSRINEVTSITPISLVALALLSAGDRSLTVEETMAVLEPFLDYVKRRDLPVTEPLALDTPERVRQALDDLTEHGVLSRFVGATDTVYGIGAEQHLAAAYYRNTIIHFFVNGAIAELALVGVNERLEEHPEDATPADPLEIFVEEALELRDLLKFEFFFPPREDFRTEICRELELQDPEWERHLGDGDVRSTLLRFSPFRSPAVLRSFIEAYRVVGDVLERAAYQSTLEPKEISKQSMALGKQYLLQGRIRHADSVSSVIFDSAISLAENRGLFERCPDMVDRRLTLAAELRTYVHRLEIIDVIVAGRRAGILS